MLDPSIGCDRLIYRGVVLSQKKVTPKYIFHVFYTKIDPKTNYESDRFGFHQGNQPGRVPNRLGQFVGLRAAQAGEPASPGPRPVWQRATQGAGFIGPCTGRCFLPVSLRTSHVVFQHVNCDC
jgi:hypothetical protein